jgi:hypothetical protein
MYIVGPAVQEDDRRTIGGAGFHISDIQKAGIDLLQWAKRRVRPGLDLGHRPSARLRFYGAYCDNRSNESHGRIAQKATTDITDLFRPFDRTHC